MFTPIHRRLGLEPGDLTGELIEQAVEEGVEETSDLDWKASLYDTRQPSWDDEAAKDIAAMANSGGGWIIFGVVEDSTTSAAKKVKNVEWPASEDQRLRGVAYSRIGPPVMGIEFHPVRINDDIQVVAMRIPGSDQQPHLARRGKNAFHAPIRSGAHTEFMSEHQLSQAYQHRFQTRSIQTAEIRELYTDASEVLERSKSTAFVMVAVPAEQVTSRPEQSERARWACNSSVTGAKFLRETNADWVHGNAKRGLRSWQSTVEDHPLGQHREVHEEGTIVLALRLPTRDGDSPNHPVVSHIEQATAYGLAFLKECAEISETNSVYRLMVGIAGDPNEPIHIRKTSHSRTSLPHESVPVRKFRPVQLILNPLEADDVLLPTVRQIALDLINQGGWNDLQYIR